MAKAGRKVGRSDKKLRKQHPDNLEFLLFERGQPHAGDVISTVDEARLRGVRVLSTMYTTWTIAGAKDYLRHYGHIEHPNEAFNQKCARSVIEEARRRGVLVESQKRKGAPTVRDRS